MTITTNGVIPYGADDECVILRDPLTSAPTTATFPENNPGSCTITDMGTVASITYDPQTGMSPNGVGGFRIQSVNNINEALTADMDNGFQIYMEIDRTWLCVDAADRGSVGYTATGNEGAIGFTATTQAGQNILPQKPSGSDACVGRFANQTTINQNFWDSSEGNATLKVTSIGKPDMVPFVISVDGGKVGGRIIYIVDVLPICWKPRNDATLDTLIDNLFIGAGVVNAQYMNGSIRNLQIATRPATFPVHPKLAKVVLWGDSQAKDLSYNGGITDDAQLGLTIIRELGKKGLYPGEFKTFNNDGYIIGDYTGTSRDSLDTALTQVTDENPDVVCIRAGNNDALDVTYNEAEALTTVANVLDTILAVNSHVEIILSGVPTGAYGAGYTSDMMASRTNLDNVYKILAAARPRVHFVDTYTALGGENPAPFTYIGQYNGANDNLHYGAQGTVIDGRGIAQAIISNVLG